MNATRFMVAVTLLITAMLNTASAEDGVEVRAAKVCAGMGQAGWNAQGPLKVDNLSVQGDVNGTITVKRDGVDLGKIDKGTYQDFTSCLIGMTKLLLPSPTPPQSNPRPPKVVKVCMGNGGGTNCLSGAGAQFDCNAYNGMGGGAQKTYDTLATMFCSYVENGASKVAPHNIVVVQNNGGGQCGWTAFQVTCNP
jgi:hypothetical protein